MADFAVWHARARVDKYSAEAASWVRWLTDIQRPKAADFERYGIRPQESVIIDPGNKLCAGGVEFLFRRLVGNDYAPADEKHAGIGIGDGSDPDTGSEKSLSGVNVLWQPLDPTFPQVSGSTITFRSTFATNTAAFLWDEYGIAIPGAAAPAAFATGSAVIPDGYVLLDRKGDAKLGKRTVDDPPWAVTVTITLK